MSGPKLGAARTPASGSIRTIERICQAVGKEGRIIHHRQRLYPSPVKRVEEESDLSTTKRGCTECSRKRWRRWIVCLGAKSDRILGQALRDKPCCHTGGSGGAVGVVPVWPSLRRFWPLRSQGALSGQGSAWHAISVRRHGKKIPREKLEEKTVFDVLLAADSA
jgi:hypothetical protein